MMKLLKEILRVPKYFRNLLIGKRRISASDNSYLKFNGNGIKAFYELIKLFGNKYSGK